MKTAELTLTQSENLRVGERGEFVVTSPTTLARCQRHGITCWVEKRRKAPTADDRALHGIVDMPGGYELRYGVTMDGRECTAGDMPRDLGKLIAGIEFTRAE